MGSRRARQGAAVLAGAARIGALPGREWQSLGRRNCVTLRLRDMRRDSGAPGFGGAPGHPGMTGQGIAEGGRAMSEQFTEPAPAAGIAQRDYVEQLLPQVLAGMPAGWSALRDAMLPGQEGEPPERLGLILVNSRVGIALVDLMPGPTTKD